MYQILIVDDEQLMREYLQYNISILCPYFSVTGVASDGLEAVELLKKQTFHVVITDIKMPEMDGLKLAGYINTHFPKIKTIIISGYSEFNYAKQAIKYNVDDYLLKPLVDDEMKEVLQKIHEEFIQDEQQSAADPLDDNSRFSAIINNPDSAYLPICQENDCEAYAVLSISIGYLSMVLENPSLENIYMHQQHIFPYALNMLSLTIFLIILSREIYTFC